MRLACNPITWRLSHMKTAIVSLLFVLFAASMVAHVVSSVAPVFARVSAALAHIPAGEDYAGRPVNQR